MFRFLIQDTFFEGVQVINTDCGIRGAICSLGVRTFDQMEALGAIGDLQPGPGRFCAISTDIVALVFTIFSAVSPSHSSEKAYYLYPRSPTPLYSYGVTVGRNLNFEVSPMNKENSSLLSLDSSHKDEGWWNLR